VAQRRQFGVELILPAPPGTIKYQRTGTSRTPPRRVGVLSRCPPGTSFFMDTCPRRSPTSPKARYYKGLDKRTHVLSSCPTCPFDGRVEARGIFEPKIGQHPFVQILNTRVLPSSHFYEANYYWIIISFSCNAISAWTYVISETCLLAAISKSASRAKLEVRSGPGYLNRISASIGGASAGVKLPSGRAAA
jgi:hypothetical protein